MKFARQFLIAWVLIMSVGLMACGSVPTTQAEVIDLAGVDQLAADFNESGADSPKLLLLLSPT